MCATVATTFAATSTTTLTISTKFCAPSSVKTSAQRPTANSATAVSTNLTSATPLLSSSPLPPSSGPTRYGRVGGDRTSMAIGGGGDVKSTECIGSAETGAALYPGFAGATCAARARWLLDAPAPPCQRS